MLIVMLKFSRIFKFYLWLKNLRLKLGLIFYVEFEVEIDIDFFNLMLKVWNWIWFGFEKMLNFAVGVGVENGVEEVDFEVEVRCDSEFFS